MIKFWQLRYAVNRGKQSHPEDTTVNGQCCCIIKQHINKNGVQKKDSMKHPFSHFQFVITIPLHL